MIPSTTQIDAHQHFWRLARGDYRWLTNASGPLYRDFGPEDLGPLLRERGIAASVLVQAADSAEETRFLLGIAERTEWVAGVVGWVDFESPRAPERIAELARHPKLVGLRPLIQDIPDDAWMLRPTLRPAFEALIANELCFDALVKPRHLEHLARLIERFPALCVVVDHGAKPRSACAGGRWEGFERWRADLRAIAAHPGVCCKLSGLVTEADGPWTVADLRPCSEALLEIFGPGRLLWGSDWPVVELAGGYDAWWRATHGLLAPLPAAEKSAILGANAVRVYKLDGAGRLRAPRAIPLESFEN